MRPVRFSNVRSRYDLECLLLSECKICFRKDFEEGINLVKKEIHLGGRLLNLVNRRS